ncbi:hypothetical protein EPI10_006204 [Gossypium australe]|uniref:Uncharacterized protein n=1 Tax=Gossypium australe TaxID=47621 RepID=A0A5B6WS26_9ROSI|nr:hypothetical protein EPI10_006204 [Gossypium australe]
MKKGLPKKISRGGPSIEKNPPHAKGFQREMDAKLGMTLCGKKGFLLRSTDFDQNGWEKLAQSCKFGFSQEVLYLKKKRG